MIKNFFILLLVSSINLFSQDSLYFVIRVDDVLSRNTTILPRSIKYFQQAVEQRGGKVTWAVIPHRLIESQNQDGVLAKELRESLLNGHEIAMHGYNHICLSCSQTSHEMFCTTNNLHFTYSQQTQLVNDGLQILNDSLNVVPKSFVPPGHSADTITYQVLLDKEFNWLSSVGGTKKFIYKTLYNLQQNNEYTWQLSSSQYYSKLNSALQDIRGAGTANGYYCLLLHDYFIRQGYSNGIVVNWIGELLDSLNHIYGNRIKYSTLAEAANIFKQHGTTSLVNEYLNPLNFQLYQNYPNPFNPTTKIRWQSSVSSRQVLKVYDVLGNAIATLVDEYRPAGYYEVEFSPGGVSAIGRQASSGIGSASGGLASGILFYQLRVGEHVQTKKMLYLR